MRAKCDYTCARSLRRVTARSPTRLSRLRETRHLALALALLTGATAGFGQTFTDAVSCEVSVYNPVPFVFTDAVSAEVSVFNPLPVSFSDAVSPEVSAFNDLVHVFNDAVSDEVAVLNAIQYLTLSSSGPAAAYPVAAPTLPDELTILNTVPPPFDPNTWVPVHRKNINAGALFFCAQVPDPLAEGFVNATWYLPDADEVTLNNCGSAFYRFTFVVPPNAAAPCLTGSANADCQGVAWLNGHRISGQMTVPGCDPTGDPNDACYALQDAGHDRTDSAGLLILTWPGLDGFATVNHTYFRVGQNELVFAVSSRASAYDPTGIEFDAAVTYHRLGDLNCDWEVDFADINPFVLILSNPAGWQDAYPDCPPDVGDCNHDGRVDFADINPFVALLTGADAGLPPE